MMLGDNFIVQNDEDYFMKYILSRTERLKLNMKWVREGNSTINHKAEHTQTKPAAN